MVSYFQWFFFFKMFHQSGTYFGTHFIMGGERFDTPQPEAYLFGENGDLNFLGSRPTAVSYLDLTHLPLCIVSTILWN